jgi:hypothetical protein
MFKIVFDDAKFIFMLSSFVGSKKRSYYWNNISIPEIAFAKLEGNNSL